MSADLALDKPGGRVIAGLPPCTERKRKKVDTTPGGKQETDLFILILEQVVGL